MSKYEKQRGGKLFIFLSTVTVSTQRGRGGPLVSLPAPLQDAGWSPAAAKAGEHRPGQGSRYPRAALETPYQPSMG